MIDRNFFVERLTERIRELRRRCTDQETFLVELGQLLLSVERDEDERRVLESLLNTSKFFYRLSQDDEREEVIKQIRSTLKTSQPFVKFWLVREGPRSSRRWEIRWTNGPTEAEIKELVAPFARKDLTFRFLRKSEPEAAKY